ncbi:MAG: ABC transporter ATP-binding protein [Desulfohalobiaceae bacterium]|nr:ABC transporter ATP-binding protein [Desulfohalobiaceae bacterium]
MNNAHTILKVENVKKNFSEVQVLQDINIEVIEGNKHAVIGPNGAGKTTLFNIISGMFPPSGGEIYFKGQPITRLSPYKNNRLGISRSFQITNIFHRMTVFENIRTAIFSKKRILFNFFKPVSRYRDVNDEALEILSMINLDDKKDLLAGALSYGEQRSLEIGITLATDPDLIMLDEPTAGMSADESKDIVKMINKVSENKTLLIIEHDMDVIFSLADMISVIHYGHILASDLPDSIKKNEHVRSAYLGDQ